MMEFLQEVLGFLLGGSYFLGFTMVIALNYHQEKLAFFKIHLLRIEILLLDIPKNNLGFDYIFYLIILDTITISLDQDFEPQNGTPACKESLYINSSFPYPSFILSYRFRKLAKLVI